MKRVAVTILAVLIALGGTLVAAPIALEPARYIDLGAEAEWVTAVELTGDGFVDLVRTNAEGRGLIPLVNRGDATFETLAPILSGHRSFRPAVAGDIDDDGDRDLVVGLVHYVGETQQIDENILVVLVNQGDGFLEPRVLATDCDAWAPWSLVDLDADGDLDIAYGETWNGDGVQDLRILVNGGDGQFNPGPRIPLSGAETDTIEYLAAFGDLGTDGLPDLFVELRLSGPMFLVNEGELEFGPPISVEEGAGEAVFADVTGDGFTDVVSGLIGQIGVWTGTGDDGVLSYAQFGTGSGKRRSGYLPTCVDDFDGDGDPDVAVPSYTGNIAVFANHGDGRFETNHEYRLGTSSYPSVREIVFGHFDGDGKKEIFVHSNEGTWLLSPGGTPPPTILSVVPERVEGGQTHQIAFLGAGFTEETVLVLEDEFRILDLRLDSPERLTASVEVSYWDLDRPYEFGLDERFDVLVRDATGGSSRMRYALAVPAYWTMVLASVEGMLKNSPKAGRDKFKAEGRIAFSEAQTFFAQAGEDCRIVIGSKGATIEILIPGEDPGWKLQNKKDVVRRMTWKSPKGATPKVKLTLRDEPSRRRWQISVKRFDFSGPQDGDIRIEMHMGEIRAASIQRWYPDGPGKLRR